MALIINTKTRQVRVTKPGKETTVSELAKGAELPIKGVVVPEKKKATPKGEKGEK